MQAKDVIRNTLDMSEMVVSNYLKDLSEAELLERPVDGMNHMAWQIGHLIDTERHFVNQIQPGSSPALPADFAAGHGRECHTLDDASKFYSVARYQELWAAQRAATRAVLEAATPEELDRTDPAFPPFAPNVGAILNLCGLHPMMHAGQFVAVRRKLGKPIAI